MGLRLRKDTGGALLCLLRWSSSRRSNLFLVLGEARRGTVEKGLVLSNGMSGVNDAYNAFFFAYLHHLLPWEHHARIGDYTIYYSYDL